MDADTPQPRAIGLGFAILLGLALLTSAPIWWQFAAPIFTGANLPQHLDHAPLLVTHAIGGTFMLGAGAAALYVGWTGRFRRWHKVIGYSYLGGGSVGALTALVLAVNLTHPPVSVGVATATLALAWLMFAAMALRAARNRRFDSHREWVIRSYVLTWTFVGCRIAQAYPVFNHLGAEGVTAGVWLYWVAPILICEVALQWRRGVPLSRAKMPDQRD
jgi:Predicted membrane protein (DUF2306)